MFSFIKEHLIFVLSFLRFTRKKSNLKKEGILSISNCCYLYKFVYTTNNVVNVKTDNDLYFRETRTHTNLKSYIFDSVDFFFANVLNEKNDLDIEKKEILLNLSNNKNYKKFIRMGNMFQISSNINKVISTRKYELIGLEGFETNNEIIYLFCHYIWSELYAYYINFSFKKGQLQTFFADRIFAHEAIADLLNCQFLMTTSKMAILDINGSKRYGVISSKADGFSFDEICCDELVYEIAPSVQKELIILNIVDVICYEKDHKPDNLKFSTKDHIIQHICSFDNDTPSSFFPSSNISFSSYFGSSSILKNGYINRPFLPEELVRRINTITKQEFYAKLKDYLNLIQIKTAFCRFKKIKNAIKKSIDRGVIKVISDKEWDLLTIKEEVSGKYGNTYLFHLKKEYEGRKNEKK